VNEEQYELPEGWEGVTLDSVLESHRGGVWGPDAENGEGYPVLRSTNMRGSRLDFSEVARCLISEDVAKAAALQAGDIIVSKSSGSPHLVGLPALFEKSPDGQTYLCSNFTMRLRPDSERIRPKYLFHFLAGAKAEADRRNMAQDTTGLRNLKTSEYLAQELPLPPLPEQTRIVAKIERLFEQSRTAREALDGVPALMKRFRQSVLASAFRGELTERDPASRDEPASVLLERIRAERRALAKSKGSKKYVEPEPPDTSDLTELPDGWVWASVADAIDLLQYGTSVKCDADEKSGVPVLRMGNIQAGQIDFRDLKFIDPSKDDIPKYLLQEGDILINRTNSPELVGKAALFEGQDRYVFASYLIRLRANSEVVLPRYLVSVINSEIGRRHVAKVKHQVAGQANINSQNIREMPVPLAPLAEQRRIVAKVEALFAQADAVERAVEVARRRAEKVDQAILARAFRGEL